MNDHCQIDLSEGPLLSKLLRFACPLFFSTMLQFVFNAADLMVVGRFSPHEAMAGIGATAALTNLLVTLFVGLSTGANIMSAMYYGARDYQNLSRTTHTAMWLSIFGGILLGGIGFVVCGKALTWVDVPDNVFPKAKLYMQLISIGIPFQMIYNFGSSLMRGGGDTQRPFIYLLISGILNVLLNLFFVLVVRWDVAGVGTATIISQAVSASLVLRHLAHSQDAFKLRLSQLKVTSSTLVKMMKFGIPAGISGAAFSITNIWLGAAINSLGSQAIAGSAAGLSLECIAWSTSYSFHQTVLAGAGQNFGAKNYTRLMRCVGYCFVLSVCVCETVALVLVCAARPLLQLFTDEPEIVEMGRERCLAVLTSYGLCAGMDVTSGGLRGIGRYMTPTIVTLVSICAVRFIWIYCVFPTHHSLFGLMINYPFSWFPAMAVNGALLILGIRKLQRS